MRHADALARIAFIILKQQLVASAGQFFIGEGDGVFHVLAPTRGGAGERQRHSHLDRFSAAQDGDEKRYCEKEGKGTRSHTIVLNRFTTL